MFIETPRFPDSIAYGSSGGPSYSTSIVQSKSGRDAVNANWSMPLYKYDVENGIKTFQDLETLLSFFHVVGGRFGGFRFKDHLDFKSCSVTASPSHTDQTIETTDGTKSAFQLIKTYSVGAYTRVRDIKKPVTGTILIGLDSVLQSSGYTVDYATGVVTFDAPPVNGTVVSWGGEFDVPVRFESDDVMASIESWKLGSMSLSVLEIRL